MKSKTPLALIELVIMILIFSLTAALCLRAFVWADQISYESSIRDQAVIQIQTAAETIKACSGNLEDAAAILDAQVSADGQSLTIPGQDFVLTAEKRTANTRGLGCAFLSAAPPPYSDAAAAPLSEPVFTLEIFWQEVASDE